MSENIKEIVNLILSLSVSGGIFALVLFALKPILRNKLSKAFQYYIWLVVLLRFILPFSFGINLMDFTLNDLSETQTAEETIISNNNLSTPMNINSNLAINDNPVINNNLYVTRKHPSIPITSDNTKPFDIIKTLADNLMWIWLAGVIISAVRGIISYLRFIRYIQNSANAMKMPNCKIKVFKSRFVPTPMLTGVFKPRIYLPQIEYTDEQLHNIMLHELTHLRRRDVWFKWFVSLVVSVHWFNPIVYFMRREFNRACELSCDEAVIRNLDGAAKKSYGDTLISVVAESRYPAEVMSVTMCEEKKKLKERLVAIMNYRKKTKVVVLITAILALVITGSALAFGASMDKKLPQSPPKITVTAKNSELSYNIGINKWNGSIYDREDTFKAIMRDISADDLPYIRLGETISIKFDGITPDSVALSDYILKADGSLKYNLPAGGQSTEITFRNGEGAFTLDLNWTAMLSSNSADYAPGATIRGFRLLCKWDADECEYAFIIRSDIWSTNAFSTENDYSISLADLRQLAAKGDDLLIEDFNDYEGQDVGSGLYILYFKIEGGYTLRVGNQGLTGKPWYATLNIPGIEENIDIRYDDIDGFIGKYHVPDELSCQIYEYLDTIMSSPLESSSTGAYIKAHQAEYDAILNMGVTSLPILTAILDDGDKGLRGNIVRLLVQDIVAAESGNPHSEWLDGFIESASKSVGKWEREMGYSSSDSPAH